jgi:hypothetical protein
MAMRLLLCTYRFESALIIAGPQETLKVTAQLGSLARPPWRCFEGASFANRIPTSCAFSSLKGDGFYRNSCPFDALMYGETDFDWPQAMGKVTIMTTRTSWPLWEPPNETLEAIAAEIAAHWNAAKAFREQSFWPDTASWLEPTWEPSRRWNRS